MNSTQVEIEQVDVLQLILIIDSGFQFTGIAHSLEITGITEEAESRIKT